MFIKTLFILDFGFYNIDIIKFYYFFFNKNTDY